MTTFPQRGGARSGFTLVELLIVIFIIIALLAILFPVVHKVKVASYVADTQSEISQLSNAISQYHTDFGAYPGPFSNDQIEGVAGGINMELYTPGATPPYPAYPAPYGPPWNNSATTGFATTTHVTAAENLVLGLLGGLRIDPTSGNPAFAPAEVGLGPMNLNSGNPKRSTAYLQTTGSNLLVWCNNGSSSNPPVVVSPTAQGVQTPQYISGTNLTGFVDGTGIHTAGDSPIPEFVDRFPSPGPMPILYLRARVGAHGVVSDQATIDVTSTAAPPPSIQFQYDLRDIYPYTASSIGLRTGMAHALDGVGSFSGTLTNQSPQNNNGAQYFWNRTVAAPLPPTTPAGDPGFSQYMDYYASPRAVDMYMLISAGPDGIYGSPDDITSFGQVSQ